MFKRLKIYLTNIYQEKVFNDYVEEVRRVKTFLPKEEREKMYNIYLERKNRDVVSFSY
jgi:DNA repair protein RadC